MSVETLVKTLAKLIKNNGAANSTVKIGIVSGEQVLVDGRFYNASYAVDVDVDDGERVYVVLSDDKSKAVVVGK